MKNYYEILEVTESAGQDEIKKSYRTLAMKYHPDKNPGDSEAEAKFKEISEAYDTLSDSAKKNRYDQTRKYGFSGDQRGGYSSQGFSDIFNDFFNQATGGSRNNKAGQNISIDVFCSIEDSIHGVEKSISFNTNDICSHCSGDGVKSGCKKDICKACHGRGRVVSVQNLGNGNVMQMVTDCSRCRTKGSFVEEKDRCPHCNDGICSSTVNAKVDIPANFIFGNTLRINAKGLYTDPKGTRGDCYVNIHPDKHEIFDITESYDIVLQLFITTSEAILGKEIEIKLPDNSIEKINIKPGTSTGNRIVIPNKGLFSRQGRGNFIVLFKVETISSSSKETQKVAKKLRNLENKDNNPSTYSLREKISNYTKKETKNEEKVK